MQTNKGITSINVNILFENQIYIHEDFTLQFLD